MKIRITGSAAECDRLLVRLAQVVAVREVSGFYPNRAPSALGRVYLEVDLAEPAGPAVRVYLDLDLTEHADPAVRADTGAAACPAWW